MKIFPCFVLFVASTASKMEYPYEGYTLRGLVDLSGCNHRTSLASRIKSLAQDVPGLLDLAQAVSLDFDQLGLMIGAALFSNRGSHVLSSRFMSVANRTDRDYTAMMRMLVVPYETDYSSVFGSRSLGYQILMRMVIVFYMPSVPEDFKLALLGVFTSFFTNASSACKSSGCVPNAADLSTLSETLDKLIDCAEEVPPRDLLLTLEQLEQKIQNNVPHE